MVLEISMELPEFGDGRTEIGIAVFVIEGCRNDDQGLYLAAFDQVVEHIFLGRKFKVFTCVPAPAVHQVKNIVFCIGIIFIVAVGRIDVGGFGDRTAAAHVILAVVIHPHDSAGLRRGFRIFRRHRDGVTSLRYVDRRCHIVFPFGHGVCLRVHLRLLCKAFAPGERRDRKRECHARGKYFFHFVTSLWLTDIRFILSSSGANDLLSACRLRMPCALKYI